MSSGQRMRGIDIKNSLMEALQHFSGPAYVRSPFKHQSKSRRVGLVAFLPSGEVAKRKAVGLAPYFEKDHLSFLLTTCCTPRRLLRNIDLNIRRLDTVEYTRSSKPLSNNGHSARLPRHQGHHCIERDDSRRVPGRGGPVQRQEILFAPG